jgi:hypothetical protein
MAGWMTGWLVCWFCWLTNVYLSVFDKVVFWSPLILGPRGVHKAGRLAGWLADWLGWLARRAKRPESAKLSDRTGRAKVVKTQCESLNMAPLAWSKR